MKREPVMPAVLLLAGIDPSGGAGLAIDIRVAHEHGVHPMPVPTCLTVQSRQGFNRSQATAPDLLTEMVEAAGQQAAPRAVKIGLLANVEQVKLVASLLPANLPVVLDPILRPTLATQGPEGLARAIREELLPHGVIVTPNKPELIALGEHEDEDKAIARLLKSGARGVALTGGHDQDEDTLTNTLYLADGGKHRFTQVRHKTGEVHGTGCAFSSALTACLAKGNDLPTAMEKAGNFTSHLVEHTWQSGPGPSTLGFRSR